jgi:hypothetical protein
VMISLTMELSSVAFASDSATSCWIQGIERGSHILSGECGSHSDPAAPGTNQFVSWRGDG